VYISPITESQEQKCVTCIEGKQIKLPFKKEEAARAKELLEIIYTDICVDQWVKFHLEVLVIWSSS
jgi:hypothetical protein